MHHSEELARNVLQAGARGYILKSDADHSLIAAIESVRQHKSFLTSTVTDFVLDDYLRRADTHDDGVAQDAVTPREREIIQLLAEGKSACPRDSGTGGAGRSDDDAALHALEPGAR